MADPYRDEDGSTLFMSFKTWGDGQAFIFENRVSTRYEMRRYGVEADNTNPLGWKKADGGASIWKKVSESKIKNRP